MDFWKSCLHLFHDQEFYTAKFKANTRKNVFLYFSILCLQFTYLTWYFLCLSFSGERSKNAPSLCFKSWVSNKLSCIFKVKILKITETLSFYSNYFTLILHSTFLLLLMRNIGRLLGEPPALDIKGDSYKYTICSFLCRCLNKSIILVVSINFYSNGIVTFIVCWSIHSKTDNPTIQLLIAPHSNRTYSNRKSYKCVVRVYGRGRRPQLPTRQNTQANYVISSQQEQSVALETFKLAAIRHEATYPATQAINCLYYFFVVAIFVVHFLCH